MEHQTNKQTYRSLAVASGEGKELDIPEINPKP
jgi:hypothetical protein